MSMRRFVAYFLAVSAGSTVAFASTLMGPPALQEAAMTETGMRPTLTDQGLDVLPTRTVRVFQKHKNRSPHTPAGTAQVALAE